MYAQLSVLEYHTHVFTYARWMPRLLLDIMHMMTDSCMWMYMHAPHESNEHSKKKNYVNVDTRREP